MCTNVNASRRTLIDADKVKYRNIIETDMIIIGCDYMGWSILVREIYDTGSEYSFFVDGKYPKTSKIFGSWGALCMELFGFLIIILANMY